MDRTRQYLLAQTGSINCIETPAAPEGGSTEEPQEGASKEAETPDPSDDEDGDDEDGDDEDGDDFDSLPPKTKAEIRRLRKESGAYRTANKELTEKLAGAKSQADIDAAVATHQGRVTELEVELAMKTHTAGFTPQQLALIDGETPEKIKDQADKVRAAFTSHESDSGSHVDPNADGGRRPGGSDAGSQSPQELAKRVRERTGRRR